MSFIDKVLKYNQHHSNFLDKKTTLFRVVIEDMSFKEKLEILHYYFKDSVNIILKIYYWQQEDEILNYMRCFELNYKTLKAYKKRTLPGCIEVELNYIKHIFFINNLMLCHFNHDFAKKPFISVRLHFIIFKEKESIFIDLYDDRGFFIHEEPMN